MRCTSNSAVADPLKTVLDNEMTYLDCLIADSTISCHQGLLLQLRWHLHIGSACTFFVNIVLYINTLWKKCYYKGIKVTKRCKLSSLPLYWEECKTSVLKPWVTQDQNDSVNPSIWSDIQYRISIDTIMNCVILRLKACQRKSQRVINNGVCTFLIQ